MLTMPAAPPSPYVPIEALYDPEPTPAAPLPRHVDDDPPRRRHGIELRNDAAAWAPTFAMLVKVLALDALTTGAAVHVSVSHTGGGDVHGVWTLHRADTVHVADYDGRHRRLPVHTITCLTVHP